ncbi:unnamed protein product [Phytomonas sp. Hart1]|nr:unnamed protein product [Phytomonas sp. Hart1]|eukprot:CCW70334.1 unnamed protein product [Phytomonas sp. isolate Hart1]
MAIGTLIASSKDNYRNIKDGPLSGRTLRTLGPGTANSMPARNIPSLGLQGCTTSSPVKASYPSNSKSKRPKDVSSKPDDEGSIFSNLAIPNTHPPFDDGKNKPREAFMECASEVHRLYRNILVNRPVSPLPFIIDQLHQELEHKGHYDIPPDQKCKSTSCEMHSVEAKPKQGKMSPTKEQTPTRENSSISHSPGVQPEDCVTEVFHIDRPITPLRLSSEKDNDTIFEEPMNETFKAPDNTSLLQVSTFNLSTKCDRPETISGDSSGTSCANCSTMSRRKTSCVVQNEGEESLPNSTSYTKPSPGHIPTLSGSTLSSSPGIRASAPPSWLLRMSPLGSVAHTVSPHPDCAPPLPHPSLPQRGFSTLSKVTPSQANPTTAVLPVFSKRVSLNGSMMAAGSTLDVRSSGSDISSVFSAAPVDVQEMLRELRVAKEEHVGMARTHVTWNEMVDILESVSFPAHDATLLADLFDELWLNQQNRLRKLAADKELAASGCSSTRTTPLWGSWVPGRKQHYVCSPFDGKPIHSAEAITKGGLQRVQTNPGIVRNVADEAVKGSTSSGKKAAMSKSLHDQPPIPMVRFETFLACMTYKIQGRYPLEVIRQAFFDLVEEYGVTRSVTSDAVSHKLGLVLESAPSSTGVLSNAKETETHFPKHGFESATRVKSNDISLASEYHDRCEGTHLLSSACCTDFAEPSVTLELSNLTDSNPDKANDGQTKVQELVMSMKSLRDNLKETSSSHNLFNGTVNMKDSSQIASNLTTHMDLMGSITSSSRLFSPHLTVMAHTVPLWMCVVEGIQGLLGLNNFDGADIEQALNMAGQPLHNLDYHCHLDEFIRLVHCVTMLVNRKLMNSSNHFKGGNLYPTLIRSAASVTASGNAGYSGSSNNNNSTSRSENERNPIMFSLNANYVAW